jgi:hypothetical protein
MESQKEYLKEYYNKNKEKIKVKMSEKIKCECGGEYTKYNKNNHEKTKLYKRGINNKPEDRDEIMERMCKMIKKKVDDSVENLEKKIKALCEDEIKNNIVEKIMKEIGLEIGSLKK